MSTLITTTVQGVQNIKYDSSTTAMTIDSGGRVLTPVIPVFWAYSSSIDSISTADTAIVFGDTDLNNGNHYSTSTGRFTAPVAGIYEFNVQALFRKTNVSGGKGELTLYKNGSNVNTRGLAFSGEGTADNAHHNTSFVYRMSLAVNDYVQPYTDDITSGCNFYLRYRLAYFSGRLIG